MYTRSKKINKTLTIQYSPFYRIQFIEWREEEAGTQDGSRIAAKLSQKENQDLARLGKILILYDWRITFIVT